MKRTCEIILVSFVVGWCAGCLIGIFLTVLARALF